MTLADDLQHRESTSCNFLTAILELLKEGATSERLPIIPGAHSGETMAYNDYLRRYEMFNTMVEENPFQGPMTRQETKGFQQIKSIYDSMSEIYRWVNR